MGRSEQRNVHPDRLIARSRQWSRAAVATGGAATLGLAGWIAVSTQTATASTPSTTTHSTGSSTKATTTTHTTSSGTSTSKKTSTSSSTATQTPQISNSTSTTPVQGTTKGS